MAVNICTANSTNSRNCCWEDKRPMVKGSSVSHSRETIPGADTTDEYAFAHNIERLRVNIRGLIFEVDLESLLKATVGTKSKLVRIARRWKNSQHEKITCTNHCETGPIYFNQNPTVFHCILDFYKTGELHLPEGVCGMQLKQELIFWELNDESTSSCCLWKLKDGLETSERVSEMVTGLNDRLNYIKNTKDFRQRVWGYFAYPFLTKPGKIIYSIHAAAYILFMLIFALQTLPQLRVMVPNRCNLTKITTIKSYLDATKPYPIMIVIDFALLSIITAFTLTQFLISPFKKLILKNPAALISKLGLISQWIYIIQELNFNGSSCYSQLWFRYLKIGRVLPIVHLLRPFRSMHIVKNALKESFRELLMLIVLLVINAVMFGYLVYILEIREDGSQFKTSMDGIWWAFVTLTTVGYGDIYPKTLGGKLLGTMCAFMGILVIALPVPIIARNFTKIYEFTELADYRKSVNCERKNNDHEK